MPNDSGMRRLLAWYDQRHGPTPAYFQRWNRRWLGVQLIAVIGVVMLNVVLHSALAPSAKRDWALFAALFVPYGVVLATAWIIRFRHTRSLRKRAEAAGYSLCDGCAYDLSAFAADSREQEVRCPECGQTVRLPDTRRTWHACLVRII
ncbi:MAG TPA: hypothetical protein VHC70_06890 [Phycisphaerales bacterium]|nr:hypothetical protein [Phycisphaerales bacterium]